MSIRVLYTVSPASTTGTNASMSSCRCEGALVLMNLLLCSNSHSSPVFATLCSSAFVSIDYVAIARVHIGPG